MDIIAETLRWVNAEREARDIGPALDDLPLGQARSTCRCPVALALNPAGDESIEVTPGDIVFYQGYHEDWVTPSDAVSQFINAFDSGDYPQYVA